MRHCQYCETAQPDAAVAGSMCTDAVACVRRHDMKQHRAIRTEIASKAMTGLLSRPDLDMVPANQIAQRAAQVADDLYRLLYPDSQSDS